MRTVLATLENRLIQMESQENIPVALKKKLVFTYDYMGRRIRKSVYLWNATTSSYATTASASGAYYYDGWNMILGDGNRYFWGLDLSNSLQGAGGVGGLLASQQSGNFVGSDSGPTQIINSYWAGGDGGPISVFYTYDGNGNITDTVGPNGNTKGHFEYGPFGEIIKEPTRTAATSATNSGFQYSTKYTDYETRLVYYGHRYYNPSTGKWISRDPIGERGGVNLYGMLDNDPINFVDCLGLQPSQAAIYEQIKIGGEEATRASEERERRGNGWVEYGGRVCLKCNDELYRSKMASGSGGTGSSVGSVNIAIGTKCEGNDKTVGMFHSHPKNVSFSNKDRQLAREGARFPGNSTIPAQEWLPENTPIGVTYPNNQGTTTTDIYNPSAIPPYVTY